MDMKTREWNPPSLCFNATRMEDGGCNTRSVLECGSPLPLSPSTDLVRPAESARGLAQSKTCRIALSFCFLLLAFSFQALAQTNYTIDWYTIDGGGGTSTGGVYAVSGTIGQPDASGAMTGGNYSLTGGFWSLIAAVQTAGLPNLVITFVGPNSIVVSWPNTGSYTLQTNNNLSTSNWLGYGGAISTVNGTNSVTVTPPIGNLFFRLKQ
jgi:hypothetical protein